MPNDGEQPWFFWYGSTEPHRRYELRSGLEAGKGLDQVEDVPALWPDDPIVRTDLLDYAVEIQDFDAHLVRMLDLLAERTSLRNTLIVVTSDDGMQSTPGKSLTDVFAGKSSPGRDFVLIGKERHDVGRPHDWGYPVRGIVQGEWLYLKNFEPDRWPAGNPETGYLNTDGSAPRGGRDVNYRKSDRSFVTRQVNGVPFSGSIRRPERGRLRTERPLVRERCRIPVR